MNLYTYSWNNSLKYFDPSGNEPITILALWAAAVSASPDTQIDMQFIADDLSRGDYLAAGLDAIGTAIPGVSGVSKIGDDVAKVVGKGLDDIGKASKKLFNIDLQLFAKGTSEVGELLIKAGDKTPNGWKLTQHSVDQLTGSRFGGKLTLNRLDELINSSDATRVIDGRSGNINIYVNSEFSSKNLMRITVPMDGQRIVSVGFERLNRITKFIDTGKFIPIK